MKTTYLCAAVLIAAMASGANAQAEPAFGSPVADFELQSQAGREDINQIAQSDSNATVTRNSVGDNSRTGDAQISGQAFQNLSGLSVLNVNTGNNVAINASMNVNISITPGQ